MISIPSATCIMKQQTYLSVAAHAQLEGFIDILIQLLDMNRVSHFSEPP